MSEFDDIFESNTLQKENWKTKFIAESKENRNRCYEMAEEAAFEVSNDGDKLKLYLDTQSKFGRYSVNNALLIMEQKPSSIKLGDYSYWKNQNVYINKQDRNHPVLILEPGDEYQREDGSHGQYYNAKKLYDITQTNAPMPIQSEVHQDMRLLVKALIHNAPVKVQAVEPDSMPNKDLGAQFEPKNERIIISKAINTNDIFSAVSLELAHVELSGGSPTYERDENAMNAYCASYIVCKAHGVDTSLYSFELAPEYFKGMEAQDVKSELGKVRTASNTISERMSRVLMIEKQPKQQDIEER